MLLGDEQGVVVAGFGCGIERYPGLALAHAGEGASAYAFLFRDEPQFVVAVRSGLIEVVELKFHLLVARGLRPDFGHTTGQIIALSDALGRHACKRGHPEMPRLPDGVFRCPSCGAEVLPIEAVSGTS